jgi:hypothetical protein
MIRTYDLPPYAPDPTHFCIERLSLTEYRIKNILVNEFKGLNILKYVYVEIKFLQEKFCIKLNFASTISVR